MGAEQEDIRRAESLLSRAHQTAGLAAYQYFFIEATPDAREAYILAMETEAEAAALLADLKRTDASSAGASSPRP